MAGIPVEATPPENQPQTVSNDDGFTTTREDSRGSSVFKIIAWLIGGFVGFIILLALIGSCSGDSEVAKRGKIPDDVMVKMDAIDWLQGERGYRSAEIVTCEKAKPSGDIGWGFSCVCEVTTKSGNVLTERYRFVFNQGKLVGAAQD